MSNKDSLFNVIKSLSKSEKKRFSQEANLYAAGENKLYVQLFQAIDKQSIYQEKEIFQKIPTIKTVAQLSSLKNKLYHYLLDIIQASYLQEETTNNQIYNYLIQGQALFNRNLPKEGYTIVQKAKKLAILYDKIRFMPLIVGLERNMVRKLVANNSSITTIHNQLIEEDTNNLQKLINENTYFLYYNQASEWNYPPIKSELAIEKELFLEQFSSYKQANPPTTFIGSSIAIEINNLIHNFQKEEDILAILNVWENYPAQQKELFYNYCSSLNTVFGYYFLDAQFSKAVEIQELLYSKACTATSEPKTWAKIYENKILVAIYSLKKQLEEDDLKDILQFITTYPNYWNVIYFLAYYYYCWKDYKEVKFWCNFILNTNNQDNQYHSYTLLLVLATSILQQDEYHRNGLLHYHAKFLDTLQTESSLFINSLFTFLMDYTNWKSNPVLQQEYFLQLNTLSSQYKIEKYALDQIYEQLLLK